MNVLFIYPNINAQVGFNYGIASISAVLKDHGHNTRLINLNEKLGEIPDNKQILDIINSFKPGLIGFSVVTPQYQFALKVARGIKSSCNIPIVCGGIHATIAAENVLQEDCFDYVCIGEGENPIKDLVAELENGNKGATIPGIWAKVNGQIHKNKVNPFIDITKLPRKDYEIFDLQKMINVETGWVRMMASRGCPFRCTYCLNHQVVNLYENDTGLARSQLNYTRRHSVDEVLSEIEFLLKKYNGINTIIFDDDIFTLDMEFMSAFCSNYPKVSNLPFVVNAHVKVFNEKRAKLLKHAGCAIVKFGVESGSQRIRHDILQRPMSNKEIIDAFAIAHKYGFHTSAFILLGLPHETKKEITETIELLKIVKPGRFRWSLFFPFPKTTAYDISLKGGYINFEKMNSLSNFTDESCLDFGAEHNLYISKIKKILPWYVNTAMDDNISDLFAGLIKKIEPLSNKDWQKMSSHVSSLEDEISNDLSQSTHAYYQTKYNSFTAVKSDWNG